MVDEVQDVLHGHAVGLCVIDRVRRGVAIGAEIALGTASDQCRNGEGGVDNAADFVRLQGDVPATAGAEEDAVEEMGVAVVERE